VAPQPPPSRDPCGSSRKASTLAPAEASRVRGRAAMPPGASRHAAAPWPLAWHGAWIRANAGSDDGASPQPDPLGHLSSRNRGSTGWRARCYTTPPSRSWTRRLRRSRRTNPALRPRKRALKSVRFVWPPRSPLSRSRQAGRGAERSACAERTCPPDTNGSRSARAVPTPSGAKGRFTRFSAKRIGIRRHPRCLLSMSSLSGYAQACACGAGLSPRFVRRAGSPHRLSPACGKHTAPFAAFGSIGRP